MGKDYADMAEVVEMLEFEEMEILSIISNHNCLVPDMRTPLPDIPPSYWVQVDLLVAAVKKLKKTRTVLWSVGCKETVWGYTSGNFDRHASSIEAHVAVRQPMRRLAPFRQLLRRPVVPKMAPWRHASTSRTSRSPIDCTMTSGVCS